MEKNQFTPGLVAFVPGTGQLGPLRFGALFHKTSGDQTCCGSLVSQDPKQQKCEILRDNPNLTNVLQLNEKRGVPLSEFTNSLERR